MSEPLPASRAVTCASASASRVRYDPLHMCAVQGLCGDCMHSQLGTLQQRFVGADDVLMSAHSPPSVPSVYPPPGSLLAGTLEQRWEQLHESYAFVRRVGASAPYKAIRAKRLPDGHVAPVMSWPSEGPEVEAEEEAGKENASSTAATVLKRGKIAAGRFTDVTVVYERIQRQRAA